MSQGELAHCMVVWYGMVLLLMGIKVPGDERVYCIWWWCRDVWRRRRRANRPNSPLGFDLSRVWLRQSFARKARKFGGEQRHVHNATLYRPVKIQSDCNHIPSQLTGVVNCRPATSHHLTSLLPVAVLRFALSDMASDMAGEVGAVFTCLGVWHAVRVVETCSNRMCCQTP